MSSRAPLRAAALAVALAAPRAGSAGPVPEELYRRGVEAYRGGKFDEAIALLAQAQALEPHAELAYDLGRAHESKGDAGQAIERYREYLRLAPEAEDRAAVEARIAALEGRLTALHVALSPFGARVKGVF